MSRDLNKVIEVIWVGSAEFSKDDLASVSLIETEFKFKVLLDEKDLIGKFLMKFNGKEYSIDLPLGIGVVPKIKMGL